jgi:hypothetical protein
LGCLKMHSISGFSSSFSGNKALRKIWRTVVCLTCFALALSVMAAETGIPRNNDSAQQTRLEIDEEQGRILIVIDGQPVGMFSADGLYVVGTITYGRNLIDVGPDYVKTVLDGKDEEKKLETGWCLSFCCFFRLSLFSQRSRLGGCLHSGGDFTRSGGGPGSGRWRTFSLL